MDKTVVFKKGESREAKNTNARETERCTERKQFKNRIEKKTDNKKQANMSD